MEGGGGVTPPGGQGGGLNRNRIFRMMEDHQINIHANFRKDWTTGKDLKIGGTEMLTEEE